MNASELKFNVEKTGSVFFTRDSMKFFGDRMSNYGVRKLELNGRIYYELFRRKPVKNGLFKSAYFDGVTFERVYNLEKI